MKQQPTTNNSLGAFLRELRKGDLTIFDLLDMFFLALDGLMRHHPDERLSLRK